MSDNKKPGRSDELNDIVADNVYHDELVEKQEQGERIYRKTLDGVPELKVDTPITYAVMEFQKSLRRALIDEGFLTMIKVDDEWVEL